MSPEEKEKAIKKLNKKLKQIEKLKQKQAAGDALDGDQKEKLATEAGILDQIKKIKAS